jgi:hypothetical protein
MASGDTLLVFGAVHMEPASGSRAVFDTRNYHPVLLFEAANDILAVFGSVLPRSYAGGGLTVYIHWAGASATSGDVVWMAGFERLGEGSQDMDSDSFAANQSVTATAPGTTGFLDIASIAFTSGAQMDSLAAGEGFRLKITRDADNGSDTMVGDAQLRFVEIKET